MKIVLYCVEKKYQGSSNKSLIILVIQHGNDILLSRHIFTRLWLVKMLAGKIFSHIAECCKYYLYIYNIYIYIYIYHVPIYSVIYIEISTNRTTPIFYRIASP